jgi:hypothetical protein
MKAQTPAQGILKTGEWGDSMSYQIICECGNPDCSHDFWVEADDHSVMVTIYTKAKSRIWDMNRWQIIWKLLTQGYVDYQSTIHMPRQTALNYAETLKTAIADVERFRKERKDAATKQN